MNPETTDSNNIHENLEALSSAALPDDKLLFHYTDAGGLIGMLQCQQLWMTSLHYQNDSQEYYYTFNLLKKILKEEYPDFLTEAEIEKFGANMSGVFTFSLSEKEDSLSQWRGYCPNGGFAISFEKQKLNDVMRRDNIRVAKCIYDIEKQKKFIIDNVIQITPTQYEEAKTLFGGVQGAFGRQQAFLTGRGGPDYLNALAPILKHPSFSQEEEWRLIKTIDNFWSGPNLSQIIGNKRYKNVSDIDVRLSKNKLIPFKKISLHNNGQDMNLKKVIISPNPHKLLALDACKILLGKYDKESYHMAEVQNSQIPYVNW